MLNAFGFSVLILVENLEFCIMNVNMVNVLNGVESTYACCCLYTGCTGITGWLFLSDDVSFIHDLNPDAE